MTNEEKREWLESRIGKGTLNGMDDDCYTFYYKAMHDYSMDFSDADRWAWLNTLFGYDIGAYHARLIINWLYENGQDAMELDSGSAYTLEGICNCELGLRLSFKTFVRETPEAVKYSYERS